MKQPRATVAQLTALSLGHDYGGGRGHPPMTHAELLEKFGDMVEHSFTDAKPTACPKCSSEDAEAQTLTELLAEPAKCSCQKNTFTDVKRKRTLTQRIEDSLNE